MNHVQPQGSGVTRARQRTPRRRINADEVWERYYEEVCSLYLQRQPPLSLNQLMEHFRIKYSFIPTKKQWKDRLSKWKVQRNLDLSTAAVILHLLEEAETQGIARRVFHNGHEKGFQHIRQYITKSKIVSNEQQLLRRLPENASWPHSVTWVDNGTVPTVPPPLENSNHIFELPLEKPPINAQIGTGPGAYDFTQLNIHPGQDSDLNIPDHLSNPFDSLEYLGFDPFQEHQNEIMERNNRPTRRQPPRAAREPAQWVSAAGQPQHEEQPEQRGEDLSYADSRGEMSTSDLETAHEMAWEDTQASFSQLYNPFESSGPPQTTSNDLLTNINLVASVTPPILSPGTNANEGDPKKALDGRVDHVLGSADNLRDQPAKHFMRLCCEAMIHYGQGNESGCEEAVRKAADAFRKLATTSAAHYEMTLPTLNNMAVLFQAYGHKKAKKRILERLRETVQRSEPGRRFVLLGAIDFLLDTADWGEKKIASNKETVGRIYAAAVKTSDKNSPLAIAARYNEAWVLLEAGEIERSLSILQSERNRCETVCGTHALQTITWNATQARAHEKAGEAACAESLMKETVLTRAEKAFSPNHPIYWEIRYRIGLFMLIFAKTNRLPERTTECWVKGEELLHETLIWRARMLGPENPQTINAYTMLKKYLELQGKTKLAADLFRSYRDEAGLPVA